MRILFIIFILCFSIHSQAQDNFKVVNNYTSKDNNKDLNQLYINKITKNISKLDSNYFTNGLIINDTGTIKCKIFLKKNKLNADLYLYILAKFDDNKAVQVLTGKDIKGFIIQGITFLSHCSNSKTVKSYSFIKLLVKGKIILFEREGIPSNTDFTYLFKKSYEENLSIITPFADNILYYNEVTSNDGAHYFSIATNKIDEKFKVAFKAYFSDCPQVVNKILSGFYSVGHFKTIVEEYNKNCK